MKIKDQTRKLARAAQNTVLRLQMKKQTRKLATGCSKHCFEVADEKAN
ncbi:hypothetical protein [Streptococcus pneumoniae]|nr:hypothetical protein [Streptococcus pneumoniae]